MERGHLDDQMDQRAEQIESVLEQLQQNQTIVETEEQHQETCLLPPQPQHETWHAKAAHGSGAGDGGQNAVIAKTWPERETDGEQEWLTCRSAGEGQERPWNECDGQQAWQEWFG